MNFLGIGTGELLLILLIVLLVMGPERLPQLIYQYTRYWKKLISNITPLLHAWQELNRDVKRQLTLEELAGQQPRPAAKPAPTPLPPASQPDVGDNSIAPPELARQTALDAASQPAPLDTGRVPVSDAAPLAEQPADLSPAVEESHHE